MLLLYYLCQEIMREGNEKERDCSVSRINTYRVGVQSEKNFFCQELGLDLNYVSQVFLVEQMNYHKKMYEKLEEVYHQCWPAGEQALQGISTKIRYLITQLHFVFF